MPDGSFAPRALPRRNPAQGSPWNQTVFEDLPNLTPEQKAKINLRRWQDEKRLKDATRTAREGFRGASE